MLTACTTGFHGSYAASTYLGKDVDKNLALLGPVRGDSCQTQALYLIPYGAPPSTFDALEAAKQTYEGTKYLVDVSFDDRRIWKFLYARQCIFVQGMAYGVADAGD